MQLLQHVGRRDRSRVCESSVVFLWSMGKFISEEEHEKEGLTVLKILNIKRK